MTEDLPDNLPPGILDAAKEGVTAGWDMELKRIWYMQEAKRINNPALRDLLYLLTGFQPETNPSIENFSKGTRQALELEGYKIYTLAGKTLGDLRKMGREYTDKITSRQHMYEKSRFSEIAINPLPKSFFLENTSYQTGERRVLLCRFAESLHEKIKNAGFEVILGGVVDYVELCYLHLEATGEKLFGSNYGYKYTWTETPTKISWNLGYTDGYVKVGNFRNKLGPSIAGGRDNWNEGDVQIVPIIIPSNKLF